MPLRVHNLYHCQIFLQCNWCLIYGKKVSTRNYFDVRIQQLHLHFASLAARIGICWVKDLDRSSVEKIRNNSTRNRNRHDHCWIYVYVLVFGCWSQYDLYFNNCVRFLGCSGIRLDNSLLGKQTRIFIRRGWHRLWKCDKSNKSEEWKGWNDQADASRIRITRVMKNDNG